MLRDGVKFFVFYLKAFGGSYFVRVYESSILGGFASKLEKIHRVWKI